MKAGKLTPDHLAGYIFTSLVSFVPVTARLADLGLQLPATRPPAG